MSPAWAAQVLSGLLAALTALPAAAADGEPVPGIRVEYFGDSQLTRKSSEERVAAPVIEGAFHGTDWGARFSGLITAPAEGEYRFRAVADTGLRLMIDGVTVIDGPVPEAGREGRARLAAGEASLFVVEYLHNAGPGGPDARLQLYWTPPGREEEPLPESALSQVTAPAPIIVRGDEPLHLDLTLPDGGLRPVPGVHNIQVFRSCRVRPDVSDGDGWTYAHHSDLAAWKGRLYVAWGMCPVDEDVRPYKVVYSTSADGLEWTAPALLFSKGEALRFYFYLAANGRMLAFTRYPSDAPSVVVQVREIRPDHSLGEAFSFIGESEYPPFSASDDTGLVAACEDALANSLLLEQSDYGSLLGERRMAWHEKTPPLLGFYPFGKAFCFYRRADGAWVGLCKLGCAIVSADGGATWSEPVLPETLVAGAGKVWGQRTSDGRYALAYNPQHGPRYPLVLVHGDDGMAFGDMRIVHGEVPRQRYSGLYKDLGPQYVRGLAEWSNDGTFAGEADALWLVYSVNKEDIWVARAPLPIGPTSTPAGADDFAAMPGSIVRGWNVYSPQWAPVGIVRDGETGLDCLELQDGDPFDYARAVRLFPASGRVAVELRLRPEQADHRLEVDLCDAKGHPLARVALAEDGRVQAYDGATPVDLGPYAAGEWLTLRTEADAAQGTYTVRVGDAGPLRELALMATGTAAFERLSLRTGSRRGFDLGVPVTSAADVQAVIQTCIEGHGTPVDPEADVPAPKAAGFVVQGAKVSVGAPW